MRLFALCMAILAAWALIGYSPSPGVLCILVCFGYWLGRDSRRR